MKINNLGLLSVACVLLALFSLKYYFDSKVNSAPGKTENAIVSSVSKTMQANGSSTSNIILPDSDVDVDVNYPVSLSYKSKEGIYALRKKYVQKSIFNIQNYQPSDEVFGQIVSGKPWYSLEICKDINTKLAKVEGASEEARFLVNPTMLVAIEYPFLWSDTDNSEFCNSSVNQLIPTRISYSKSKNEITVNYAKLPFSANEPYFYDFNGVNANDLGYKYVYVDLSKSTFKPRFTNSSNNVSTRVQEFQNFIHLGSSCRHEGGCNNGSPRQPNLEFNMNQGEGRAEIYIKLWRTKPASEKQEADITEKIVIES